MPTVPAGQAVYPVLTSRPTVGGFHRDSTSVADTTGAFSADVLTPGRLQAAFFYRRTDAAKFPGMAEALRAALNSGLSEALDQEILDQIVSDVSPARTRAQSTHFRILSVPVRLQPGRRAPRLRGESGSPHDGLAHLATRRGHFRDQ